MFVEEGGQRSDATLVERSEETSEIERLLSKGSEGVGGLTLVAAPPGIGKSRLLRWAAETAERMGMRVLRARSAEAERALSFGVVLQLFEGFLATASEEQRSDALAGVAALSLPLFEGAHWSAAAEQQGQGGSNDALLHGLFWLAANMAASRPLLLCVDDAHWSDPVSLRFILHLAQRIDELPIALLLAYREGEVEDSALPPDLLVHPLASRLRPAPLRQAGVSGVLSAATGSAVGERFAAACHEATGGNPFLLWAVVRALDDDELEPSDGNAAEVKRLRPEVVSRQALARVSRLGEHAARLVSAAAVAEEGASLARVAEMAELDAHAAAGAADALVSADILASADPVSFAHPLLRAAVYEEVPKAKRALDHLRAAELLRDDHAPAESVAAHLLRSARCGQEWAPGVLRQAATAALSRGNPASAVDYLTRLLEEPLRPDARAEALLELGRSEALLGREEAKAHIADALSLTDDARAVARAQKALGDILYVKGDLRASAEAFEQGLALVADDDELARDLHAGYFSAASLDANLAAGALRHVEPLLERPPGDETGSERAVLASLAAREALVGARREKVLSLARRAWGDGALLAEEGADGWGWHLVTAAFTWSDSLAESSAICTRVIEQAQERGLPMAYATASYCAQLPRLAAGEIREARALGEAALDAHRFGWHTYLRTAAAIHAYTLIEQDEPAAASEVLRVLDDELHADAIDRAPALAARGRLRLIEGRPREALKDNLDAGEMYGRIGGTNPSLVPWRTAAALAAWQLGDEDLTSRLLGEEAEVAEASNVPTHLSGLLRARAQTVGAAEEVDLLRAANEALEGSEARLERLRCKAELGAALRRAGGRGEAREILSAALEEAHELGARRLERIVHAELRVAGARPRRLQFSGPDSLTASERRVAGMAASGMGNRDIAQALFVTTRTVEQHLYNTYKKLGISSRVQLEGALAGEAQ